MNVALPHSQRLRELERVRLLGQYSSDDGTLPPGTIGTIVHRHRGGRAFEVEFAMPFAAVVMLRGDEITRFDG